MRDATSTPDPPSVPSVGVKATVAVAYQVDGEVRATDGVVGAVVSFVIVTGEPVVELPARSWAMIASPPGEVVAPAVHE